MLFSVCCVLRSDSAHCDLALAVEVRLRGGGNKKEGGRRLFEITSLNFRHCMKCYGVLGVLSRAPATEGP